MRTFSKVRGIIHSLCSSLPKELSDSNLDTNPMSINIGGYDFDGPYYDPDEIKEELGVYVVLCFVEEMPHCVLDIGTAVGGIGGRRARMVTRTGNLRHRLKSHDRQDCWRKNVHGKIGYAVRYIYDTDEQIGVEKELQWKLDYACGRNPWKDIELAWQEYQEFEQRFGPRGSVQL